MFGSLGDGGGSKFVIMEDAKEEDMEQGGKDTGGRAGGGVTSGLGGPVGVWLAGTDCDVGGVGDTSCLIGVGVLLGFGGGTIGWLRITGGGGEVGLPSFGLVICSCCCSC